MLSTSTHPASAADGLRWCPVYGLQDVCDISGFIDAQPYDLHSFFTHPEGIDPQLLLLDQPPPGLDFGFEASAPYPSESEFFFDGSHSLGWLQGPYLGQQTIPEMEVPDLAIPAVGGGTIPVTQDTARSCSPASEASMLSDSGSSSSSDFGAGGPIAGPSSSGSGPSGSHQAQQCGQLVVDLGTAAAIGPVRRGRGRPRKDAPPVYQPPPLCAYIDPLTHQPCGKLLNRHHDLPRHMVKHRQEEAALVNAGRLPREYATLLPSDWTHSDEFKLPCRFCSATFSRADAVKRHEKREHKKRPHKG